MIEFQTTIPASPEEYVKIQKLILDTLAIQDAPIKDSKLRDLCKNCEYSVRRNNEAYPFYKYFHPLVRAGLAECVLMQNAGICWQLSPASVFYHDKADLRHWIGLNLTDSNLDEIPQNADFSPNNDFDDYVFRWTTDLTYQGESLPVVENPSVLQLLKTLPECCPEVFATENSRKIFDGYKKIYNPRNKQFLDNTKQEIVNGFYRKGEEYSEVVYYRNGKIYELTQAPDSRNWARIMHCVDNKISIAEYDESSSTIQFGQNLPFIIARILFLNQMFTDFNINNNGKYSNINYDIYRELNRIFRKRINKK